MSDHKYGPHSDSADFTLLYTQKQMDAMTARATSLERERCAQIADEFEHSAAAGYIATRIRSSK